MTWLKLRFGRAVCTVVVSADAVMTERDIAQA